MYIYISIMPLHNMYMARLPVATWIHGVGICTIFHQESHCLCSLASGTQTQVTQACDPAHLKASALKELLIYFLWQYDWFVFLLRLCYVLSFNLQLWQNQNKYLQQFSDGINSELDMVFMHNSLPEQTHPHISTKPYTKTDRHIQKAWQWKSMSVSVTLAMQVNVTLAMSMWPLQWKSANLTMAMEVSQCDPHNGSESANLTMAMEVSQCDPHNGSESANLTMAMEVSQCDPHNGSESANLTMAMEVSQCDPHNGSESTWPLQWKLLNVTPTMEVSHHDPGNGSSVNVTGYGSQCDPGNGSQYDPCNGSQRVTLAMEVSHVTQARKVQATNFVVNQQLFIVH